MKLMKIVVNKGESIEDAITAIKNFLEQNYSEYPILKNTMNLYVTLQNDINQICPDNQKEFILNKGKVKDVDAESRENAFTKILEHWNGYLRCMDSKMLSIQHKIELNKNYIDTALMKGRKKENVIKRKKETECLRNELEDTKMLVSCLNLLNEAIQSRNFSKFFYKSTYGSAYKYKLDCVLVFENVNGYTCYFDRRGLHNGLPKEY